MTFGVDSAFQSSFNISQMNIIYVLKSKRMPDKAQNTFLEGQQQSVNNNVEAQILMVMNPNFDEQTTKL